MGAGTLCAIAVLTGTFRHPALSMDVIWLAAAAVVVFWVVVYRGASWSERLGLRIMYLLTAQSMLFFVFNQQIGTSLTLFAARCVNPDFYVLGQRIFSMLPGQFQAFNTIWLLTASPVMSWLYARMDRAGYYVALPTKFMLGFGCLALSFLTWWLSDITSGGAAVSPWWMVVAYGLFSIGELLVSALGLAAVARYAPRAKSGLLMGSFFVTNGVAMYLGSMVAALGPGQGSVQMVSMADNLVAYGHLFRGLFIFACIGIVAFAAMWPLAGRWDEQYRTMVPVR